MINLENKIKKPAINLLKEDAITLIEFLKTVEEVQILSYDEPLDGVKGFHAFHYDKTKKEAECNYDPEAPIEYHPVEHEISFGYCFAKPVEPENHTRLDIDYENSDPTLADAENFMQNLEPVIEQVEKCLTEDGWCICDNPKMLKIGFIKYASLDSDSNEKSEYVSLRLSIYKTLPKELQDRVQEFRTKDLSTKEKDLIEQIEEAELR